MCTVLNIFSRSFCDLQKKRRWSDDGHLKFHKKWRWNLAILHFLNNKDSNSPHLCSKHVLNIHTYIHRIPWQKMGNNQMLSQFIWVFSIPLRYSLCLLLLYNIYTFAVHRLPIARLNFGSFSIPVCNKAITTSLTPIALWNPVIRQLKGG